MVLVVEQGREYICTLALYPVEDIYGVSDRNAEIPDRVYPALVENVQRFLQIIPRSRCESFLEVCSGTGIAALSSPAEQVDLPGADRLSDDSSDGAPAMTGFHMLDRCSAGQSRG